MLGENLMEGAWSWKAPISHVSTFMQASPSFKARRTLEDVSSKIDIIEWWKSHKHNLPNWAQACRLVLLVQPSSAAAERVFSILTSSFSSQQQTSLEDYIQLSAMLQYNNRQESCNHF